MGRDAGWEGTRGGAPGLQAAVRHPLLGCVQGRCLATLMNFPPARAAAAAEPRAVCLGVGAPGTQHALVNAVIAQTENAL